MASISVPCPKCSLALVSGSTPKASAIARFARIPRVQVSARSQSLILRAQAQGFVMENSNSSSLSSKKLDPICNDAEVEKRTATQDAIPEATIAAFMAEVADLVKLVDSRDITELQLKQNDCELIIRKKEALQQPPIITPPQMMQPPPQASFSPQAALPHAVPPPVPGHPAPSSAAPALPPPAKSRNSSLPPLLSPMAGNFYTSPAPGEPPFVKVGDKVKKGQVVCIIEAMKLMNSIEADQSGTIVEILVENGQPISVDTPLFIIQP